MPTPVSTPGSVVKRQSVLPEYAALYWSQRRVRAAPYRRSEVFARWEGRCAYCDAPAEHLDHVKPISKGGRDVLSNVVPACAGCNLAKASLTLAQWALSWSA
ncbi:HNH endonuclease [Streptomyces mirabilis]|uniref:HNH endonuclease n=1 Tax=Streptomyces mirabilis TaxID=68239 RepID=UPI0036C50598